MIKTLILFLFLFLFNTNIYSQLNDSLHTEESLSNVNVLLYQKISDSTSVSGTGTILQFYSRFFILTANHIAIELKETAKIVFRLENDRPGIFNLNQFTKDKINWKHHAVADISLIEVYPNSNELSLLLRKSSFPLEQIYDGRDFPNRLANLTYFGFPITDLELEYFSPLIFTSKRSSGLITQKRYDTKNKCTFYFLNSPSVQGCSGSGLYFSVKTGGFDYISSSEKTMLIGVVHGTHIDNTGGKLAAITPSFYIVELLKEFY